MRPINASGRRSYGSRTPRSKAAAVKQREIGFERGSGRRVTARLGVREACGRTKNVAVTVTGTLRERRSLRRDPSKFGGLAHFLIIGMNEFAEAIRRHLLGGGEFRAHFAQLVSCRSTGKSSSDCFLQLSDDRSRRAYGCKYSNIALSGEVLHTALDKGRDVGRELGAAARRNRNDVGLAAFVQRQCGGKFRHCCLNTASD